jgi:hypothetical protein
MSYWTSESIVKQVAGEIGIPFRPPTVVNSPSATQVWAFLNAAGNDLVRAYPWGELVKEWVFTTEVDKGEYTLPDDWSYFIDQTQWDRTNHWPLLGPKSAQEWAWLKGGLLAMAPRMRYRVIGQEFNLWPVPGADNAGEMVGLDISMEYINKNWVRQVDGTLHDMVVGSTDTVLFDPWLMVKLIKLKFYELKGFNIDSAREEFFRLFLSLTGKDKGAPKLSLAPLMPPLFIGPWSIPDGSWDTSSSFGT